MVMMYLPSVFSVCASHTWVGVLVCACIALLTMGALLAWLGRDSLLL